MMNNIEMLEQQREEIRKKLAKVDLSNIKKSSTCWTVGTNLRITGVTVENYLRGRISDGYLAEAIYREFETLGFIKK
jgi:hypothetical protein